ncbi:uncharacterized protein MELLADRAFT_56008 [Melampsora larici-populina 98AG31]|uniref:Uncharacterized protein n=1 Tax=Melampsora larici-populina (strain 98AG31 / pathotype 3-4-7) TaxID=747676 RepID=F4RKM9_MELLP|nr:uncharacterized protein MELLADRAFT_56008 [Melampsora larici-populina 98AG31]EGG07121.1 hypothetical protein MELLADRAFT_56008 [Melampsora larici-populina 98AG31]
MANRNYLRNGPRGVGENAAETQYPPNHERSVGGSGVMVEKLGFFRTSPMGVVTNGDGTKRVINDLLYPKYDDNTPSVNSFVDKMKFKTTKPVEIPRDTTK